ncbi:hypothetical protein [Streptomyces sp. NBC_01618]|uniref:hypothetical protein n=1 Tax=Streptomyces sp. NBC_01618 TaxID=2975900 RepID=UPI00386CD0D0|nr:hypothetical protein OH735_34485 [Streptomyces sp. NBC_01618]
MRAIGVAPVALLGVAVLALTAPAATAWAETSGGASSATGYTVTPSVIVPGSQVALVAPGVHNCWPSTSFWRTWARLSERSSGL